MKKIFLLFLPVLILFSVHSAFAEDSTQTLKARSLVQNVSSKSAIRKTVPTSIADKEPTRIDDLKTRGDQEIKRRIDALEKLKTRINGIKRLSTTQKSDLTGQIQTQIDNLNILKTKIDADTDITVLKTDLKSIVSDYRIFVFFIQDINLMSAAERIGNAIGNLTLLSGKLETRISEARSKGENVTSLETKYQGIQANLIASQTLLDEVNSELSGLNASGYPANKTSLEDARKKLKQAFPDLKIVHENAIQIIRLLKQLEHLPTLTPTLTPTPTI